MSNTKLSSIEKSEPKHAEAEVSPELRRALDVMAAFSRDSSPEHEVEQIGSYTIVRPLRQAY